MVALRDRVRLTNGEATLPVWCPWPLPPGWTVTGIAWAGDERTGPRATAVALSGPAPLSDGPADIVFVAEEPGRRPRRGARPASTGPDPGSGLRQSRCDSTAAPAKVRVAGHPTPLWSVESAARPQRRTRGRRAGSGSTPITWPAPAGYLFAESIVLHDLAESVPSELVFGAPSGRLRPVLRAAVVSAHRRVNARL